MDEDKEAQQLPDLSNYRLNRHTDAVVAVGWSRTQVDLVASGACDDKAFLWRLDKDGAPMLSVKSVEKCRPCPRLSS